MYTLHPLSTFIHKQFNSGYSMKIIIRNSSADPIYQQILDQLKAQIMAGEITAGQLLPSIRNLAQDLKISVITVKRTYEELEKEGFITTVVGKGTFVSAQNNEFMKEKKMRAVEEKLQEAVKEAKMLNISLPEITEMLNLLYAE